MAQTIRFQTTPAIAANDNALKETIAQQLSVPVNSISGYHLQKKSLDARSREVKVNLTADVYLQEEVPQRPLGPFRFAPLQHHQHQVVIVGAGPAGLYAALFLLEQGIKPIIIERGKDVRARRRDLAQLNKTGEVNPDSNYCFGEGGAGTYSDGKLYTRSNKRGNLKRILELFVYFGADERILYEAHPHIGTNKLPHIITAMRNCIVENGGEILFEEKLIQFLVDGAAIKGVLTQKGNRILGDAVILATGHSARDIFIQLHEQGIMIEAKPFALGVRIEHPQSLIDSIQYKCPVRSEFLPPSAYSLVEQVNDRGVFSFCMCPGGIIAPAATDPGELVVNGWSPSKRNNPFANSGMVTEIRLSDLIQPPKDFTSITGQPQSVLTSPLGMMYFQQYVERKSFIAGGGKFVAPAQRMADFVAGKTSSNLPECSYIPGLSSQNLSTLLPNFVAEALQGGFKGFGKKMRGYLTNEAIVVATESRTSSPVRIPRDANTLEHPQLSGLFPCGEGAGYAGGIVSAAMDGEKVAARIAQNLGITLEHS